MKPQWIVLAIALLVSVANFSFADEEKKLIKSKPATIFTKTMNAKVREHLPFENKEDFVNARKGFIGKPDVVTIKDEDGHTVWSLEKYKEYISLDKQAPDTVNPSLWRNAQLGMFHGLFEVTEDIYQVRSYDLSNITFVRSALGWIVFDPLISPETAKAALDLVEEHFGESRIAAVVYSHSHVDHYGGVTGLLTKEQAESGDIPIIAPEGFTEEAVSENVIAGNAMARRAVYMYGALLPRNEKGGVNGGLGMTTSTGLAGLYIPNDLITEDSVERTIGGIKMVFQLTPGSEAPAEMNTWFPNKQALWMAENTTNTMHNILTLRGAKVRDPLMWAKYLNTTIETWGNEVKVKFQSHHWPLWGQQKIVSYFKKQRDIYKYIHDQSVRLMNQGYTGEEISEKIKLPPELEQNWSTRGYYGTLRHNSRAVYQRYMGWYDGHPSSLNNLPPEEAAVKYVKFMGGETALLENAKKSFNKGQYRWVAEVVKHAVFANPESEAAKELLADSLEQLGYQAESGPWRSVYLQGAYELRHPELLPKKPTETATPDTIRAMTPEMLFDYLAVRLIGEQAAGKVYNINITLTDLMEQYALTIENAVLNYSKVLAENPDLEIITTMDTLNDIQLGEKTLIQAVTSKDIFLKGDKGVLTDFLSMLDTPNFWFNIVTP